jgi:protein gp37
MAQNSKIEWTEVTWNPITGCTKISAGCQNCYAERMSKRLQAIGMANYKNGFDVTIHEHVLDAPKQWRKPRRVFVNSMSDLFHKDVPESFIDAIFEVMAETSIHNFQVLTKRSARMREFARELPLMDNIWLGVTVENSDYLYRINNLKQTQARVKFISFEPLLGPIPRFDLAGIDWVIVGGESGPHSRPIKPEWVTDIRDQCVNAGVNFFFKQWGGFNKKKTGRLLEGRTWNEMPLTLSIN